MIRGALPVAKQFTDIAKDFIDVVGWSDSLRHRLEVVLMKSMDGN